MGISIRPQEIEKRLARILSDQTIFDAFDWLVTSNIEPYIEKLQAPVTTNFPDAQAKYLRINGAIEALRGLRQSLVHYKNNVDKETLLDQT